MGYTKKARSLNEGIAHIIAEIKLNQVAIRSFHSPDKRDRDKVVRRVVEVFPTIDYVTGQNEDGSYCVTFITGTR